MNKLVKIKNVSPVKQLVPGRGAAEPGEDLEVSPRQATHLLLCKAVWQPAKMHTPLARTEAAPVEAGEKEQPENG